MLAQSIAHLLATGTFGTTDSIVDLDRSNGVPDVVSTLVIVAACTGAVGLVLGKRRWERVNGVLLAACLGVIAVDDVVGVNADASTAVALAVTTVSIVAAASFAAADQPGGTRAAVTIGVGLVALAGALAMGQLPELEQWFERTRGDRIIELQIIVKQGLELAGWGLVAIGVWDTALAAQRPEVPVDRRPTRTASR